MNRRSPYDNIRTAAWMACLSALLAFVVVGVGEASAHARKGRNVTATASPVVTLADIRLDVQPAPSRAVRVVYPAVVVTR